MSDNGNTVEVWKDIVDYEGYYQVSTFGNVRSQTRAVLMSNGITKIVKGKTMAISPRNRGYMGAALTKNGKATTYSVHRLVATAFLPNPEIKPAVNHIDCNPSNNRVDNLEWCTYLQNTAHAMKNGAVFNQKRTHCTKGHLLDEANVYIRSTGDRSCKPCGDKYMKGYHARHYAELRAKIKEALQL